MEYKQQINVTMCLLLAVAGMVTLGGTPNTARAQVLEVVEVTARRRVEKDLDVPISMTVMSEEYLRQQNIASLTDLGVKMPSLQITSTATSPNAPIVAIRGQRPNDLNISADQAVPIYFNEVVLTPSEGSNLAIYDLQNVQVLKGPQGTLFGRNSTGGALLLTPTRPGEEFAGYLETKVGNYNLAAVEGAVDLPISDSVQLRLSGRRVKRDGWQKNVADNALYGKRYWDENSQSVRVALNISPREDLRNLLVLSYDSNDIVGRAAVMEAFNSSSFIARRMYHAMYNQHGQIYAAIERLAQNDDKHEIESDLLPSDKVSVIFVSNTSELDITDRVTFKSILGFRDVEYEQAIDADGTTFPFLGAPTSATQPVTVDPALTTIDTEQLSIELQLLGDAFDTALEWLGGVYGFRMSGTRGGAVSQVVGPLVDDSMFQNPPPDDVYDLAWASVAELTGMTQYGSSQTDGAGDATNTAFGIFFEGTYHFNERWSWTLGGRYSRDDRKVVVRNFNGIGTEPGQVPLLLGGYACATFDENEQRLPDNACERAESKRFQKPSWRTSVNFTPVDGMLLYGSISTGYRTGGFNMRGGSNDQLEPYSEETVINYEIGHKADWTAVTEIPVRSNFALFYQDYENIQQTQTFLSSTSVAGAFATRIINAAEAAISGAELDVTAMVTENLSFSVACAYTDARYKEFAYGAIENRSVSGGPPTPLDDVNVVVLDNSDSDFMFVPKTTFTATITYFLPIDPMLGDMSLMTSVFVQDDQNTLVDPALLDEIAVLQAWEDDDLQIAQASRRSDGYELINVRFDWRNIFGSQFDLALYVDNAKDEDYVVGGLNVIDILGFSASTYGPPRTYGASLHYSF